MTMIRRKKLPKLLKTAEIAERWGYSQKQVRRILTKYDVRRQVFGSSVRPKFKWVETDVLKVEEKIFAEVL